MQRDIIERLDDPELYVDAVDDAIAEIENLRREVQHLQEGKVDGLISQLEGLRGTRGIGYSITRGARGRSSQWKVDVFGGDVFFQDSQNSRSFTGETPQKAVQAAINWVNLR